MPQAPAQGMALVHRVKVYKLNGQGGWDDKGTGLVSVEYMKQSDAMGIVVISEEDTRTLLVHRISKDDIYHRQGDDTIITWTDPGFATDIALSFQEATGCNHIWQQLQDVRNEHQGHGDAMSQRRRMVDEFESVSAHFEGDFPDAETSGMVDIPAPEMGKLEEIAKVLLHVSPFQRERLASQLNQPGYPYLKALLELFRQCEDLEDKGGLACMYRIFKGIIMLNDSQILEELMKDEYAMDVMGALEYDPDLKQPQKHREYLAQNVKFKEVVPISDRALVAKIHQTYRIAYLKDVILPRALDDATHATLTSLALFNNVEVILALHQDAAFLPQLFHKLKVQHPGDPEWSDLVAFLQELCSLAKHLQPAHRVQLFSKLVNLGLFETVTKVMKHGSQDAKLRATDILMSCVTHDPTPLRHFLSQKQFELFSLIIKELLSGEHCGLAEQVAELLKIMMDPETSEQALEKSEFLDMFYEHYIHQLVGTLSPPDPSLPNGDAKEGTRSRMERERQQERERESASKAAEPAPNGGAEAAAAAAAAPAAPPAAAGTPAAAAGTPAAAAGTPAAAAGMPAAAAETPAAAAAAAGTPAVAAAGTPAAAASAVQQPTQPPLQGHVAAHAAGLIVELLCFCVQNHSYRIKYFILRNQVVERVLRLLKRREKWLVVAAVRFLRACIGLKDEFYNRYFIRQRVFEPVLDAFLLNGDRYNMLNSAVLEMVEFIRRENVRNLVAHLVEQYGGRCGHVAYVDTFKQLRTKYEQSQERGGSEEVASGPDQATSALSGRAQLAIRKRRDARDMDKDEEDYFSEDGDIDSEETLPPGPSFFRERSSLPSHEAMLSVPYAHSNRHPHRPHTPPDGNPNDPSSQGPLQPHLGVGTLHASARTNVAGPSPGMGQRAEDGPLGARGGHPGGGPGLGLGSGSRGADSSRHTTSQPSGGGGSVVVGSGGWQGLGSLVDYDDEDDDMTDAQPSSPGPPPRGGASGGGNGPSQHVSSSAPSRMDASSPGEKHPGDPAASDPAKRLRPVSNGLNLHKHEPT